MKKRSDGRYSRSIVTGYDQNGKQTRKTFYAKTKWELDKKANEWKANFDKGLALRTEPTFGELCDMWLEGKRCTIKEQSYVTYVCRVSHLKARFGSIKVTKLSVNDFISMRNEMLQEGKATLFNRILLTARQVLNYGINLDYLVSNVGKKVATVSGARKSEKRAFTEAERELILNADLDLDHKALVYLLFYTGIRRGELCALTTSDIDFNKRRIKIEKTLVARTGEIQRSTKTSAGVRFIPITAALYDVLWKYVHSIMPGLLFTTKCGNTLRAGSWDYIFDYIIERIFGSPDYEVTAHMFRHNYCSDLCKAGVPVRTAMYLMGHSDMQMTLELYSHVSAEDIDMLPLEQYYENRASIRESKALKPTKKRALV